MLAKKSPSYLMQKAKLYLEKKNVFLVGSKPFYCTVVGSTHRLANNGLIIELSSSSLSMEQLQLPKSLFTSIII